MPAATPFHERTAPLCRSLRWKDWAGCAAVCSYDTTHDRECFAFREENGSASIALLGRRDAPSRLGSEAWRDRGMPRSGRRRLCLVGVAAAVLPAALAAATPADTELELLLAASDVLSAAPRELRAELRVAAGSGREPRTPLELWRKGEAFALVRFLAPRDLGKFVVRRDGDYYLLLPDGRPAKRLARALVPAGGMALDDLLSLRPSSDYALATAAEASGLVTYDLVARAPSAGVPRLRWVVDRTRRRPVRAELRDLEDRIERLVEFTAWRPGVPPEPASLVAKDLARGGRPLVVEILSIEAREVPAALFDLTDGTTRARLPPPSNTTSP